MSHESTKNVTPSAVPPLFKGDSRVTLAFTVDHGKIRVAYKGWPDPKVLLADEPFVVSLGPQGLEGRIRAMQSAPH